MLRAENLSKFFGERLALDRLDLEIGSGEICCLLGANGAGKTTTVNLFLGFLLPSCGAAYVNGCDVVADPVRARANLAYVPEQVNLYPTLSGLENLSYFSRLANSRHGPAQLREFLQQVGLPDAAVTERVERYSKGMRQKVGLAIALAKRARALVLDEPLSGLDPQAANEFCTLLRALANRGCAVLMVTHDLFRAREIADHIGIMRNGRLVERVAASAVTHDELERAYLNCMRDRAAASSTHA